MSSIVQCLVEFGVLVGCVGRGGLFGASLLRRRHRRRVLLLDRGNLLLLLLGQKARVDVGHHARVCNASVRKHLLQSALVLLDGQHDVARDDARLSRKLGLLNAGFQKI